MQAAGGTTNWNTRKIVQQTLFEDAQCDILCVQESNTDMLNDVFLENNTYRTVAYNTEYILHQNWDDIKTTMPKIWASITNCAIRTCHLNFNPADNCQPNKDMPVNENIGYHMLYNNTNVTLLGATRVMFTQQGGCPIWDNERFYEHAEFISKPTNEPFHVFAFHMSQAKKENDDKNIGAEGWGTTVNAAQCKELYTAAHDIYKGGGKVIIAGDSNNHYGYFSLIDGFKTDKTPQNTNNSDTNAPDNIDYICSSKNVKTIDFGQIKTTSTDHDFLLWARYVFEPMT